MHHRVWIVAAVVVTACGQNTYSTATRTSTTAGPDETYACVKKQLGELGYKQTSNDADELRVTGSKFDYESRRPDVQFRRMVNKLEVDVAPDADGTTTINALGRTFAEYSTQRGPTEQEEKPSRQVQSDTETLFERCRS